MTLNYNFYSSIVCLWKLKPNANSFEVYTTNYGTLKCRLRSLETANQKLCSHKVSKGFIKKAQYSRPILNERIPQDLLAGCLLIYSHNGVLLVRELHVVNISALAIYAMCDSVQCD